MIGFVSGGVQICIDLDDPSPPSSLSVSGDASSRVLGWGASVDTPSCSGIDEYVISRKGVEIGRVAGDYVFYTKVSYRNITASSTDSFKVVERWDLLTIVIWSLVTLFILFLIFFIWRRRKHKKEVKVLEHKKRHLHKNNFRSFA